MTTDFDLEVVVIALCPTTFQFETAVGVAAHVDVCVNTGTERPVVVDFHNRLKTENPVVLIDFVCAFFVTAVGACALVGVLNLAMPNDFVGIFFEFSYADAESVEFITEFSREAVEFSFACAARILRHSFCNHLRHFVTGNVAFAAIGAVAVTFDNALSREFRYRLISPVTCRNIAERIRRCE